ncbi:hypothetical protein DW125_13650 [Dorea sp. AM10-31]|nr:hypothetical protein DW125_13650 [Dorea sp. AM10-31]
MHIHTILYIIFMLNWINFLGKIQIHIYKWNGIYTERDFYKKEKDMGRCFTVKEDQYLHISEVHLYYII